jgi:hypothetical protein
VHDCATKMHNTRACTRNQTTKRNPCDANMSGYHITTKWWGANTDPHKTNANSHRRTQGHAKNIPTRAQSYPFIQTHLLKTETNSNNLIHNSQHPSSLLHCGKDAPASVPSFYRYPLFVGSDNVIYRNFRCASQRFSRDPWIPTENDRVTHAR